jgi:hypothetical protein
MNEDAMSQFVPLTKNELFELTKEVHETIAFPLPPSQQKSNKTFSEVTLWFRRRYIRSASKRNRK